MNLRPSLKFKPAMTLRSIVFWLHLSCGVVAGAVILMMSVTGACSHTSVRLV